MQAALKNCELVQQWCTRTAPLCTYRVITTCTAGVTSGGDRLLDSSSNNNDGDDDDDEATLAHIEANQPKVVGMTFRAGRAGARQARCVFGVEWNGVGR